MRKPMFLALRITKYIVNLPHAVVGIAVSDETETLVDHRQPNDASLKKICKEIRYL